MGKNNNGLVYCRLISTTVLYFLYSTLNIIWQKYKTKFPTTLNGYCLLFINEEAADDVAAVLYRNTN